MMAVVRFEAECPGASKVCMVGDFNNWDPEARRMKRVRKGEDVFVALVELEPGRQEFKLVIDGEWQKDLQKHPLIAYAGQHENLVITPHIGGVTHDSQQMAYNRIIEKLINYFQI